MTRTQRIVLISTTAVVGVVLLAASLYLGLDRTDKLASIVSAVAGVGSLAVAVFQLTQPGAGGSGAPSSARQVQRGGDNSTNIQSGGNINMGDSNRLGGDR
ncbi:hypothetical protein [Streptomyces sp. NPDC007883]|uniref:hypothetical protein n=1 Tax=Streptomyces sp. NPDC007883 TaxID=3155116 RepID=UPI00340F7C58